MSKSIKVSEEVYDNLRSIQKLRESYSDTIKRLIVLFAILDKALPLIHGTYAYLKFQKEQREQDETAQHRDKEPGE